MKCKICLSDDINEHLHCPYCNIYWFENGMEFSTLLNNKSFIFVYFFNKKLEVIPTFSNLKNPKIVFKNIELEMSLIGVNKMINKIEKLIIFS